MSERDDWLERFEQAGPMARLSMLGGGAVRLAARAIDGVLDRAATIAADAEDAFRKELDPNVRDATILSETEGPPDQSDAPSGES